MATYEPDELKNRKSSKRESKRASQTDVLLEEERLRKRLSKTKVKRASKRNILSGTKVKNVNPFQCDERLNATETLKLVGGIILIPIRFAIILITVAISTVLMSFTVAGCDVTKPLPAERFKMQRFLSVGQSRIYCFCFGIYSIKIKGKKASSDSCKMLVMAPHSTVMDALVTGVCFGSASAVGKQELADSIVGPLFTSGQMIFVDREDKDNKKNVARQIKERVAMDGPWKRQLALAPEGTCTNRTSLIQFKKGAFDPGEPVQPVVLHWQFNSFDPSWTAGAFNRGLIIARCLSQPYQEVTVEFMDVYHPNEEEKQDAILFANNVRDVMAKKLKIPTSEYSYPDMFLAKAAAKKKLKPALLLPFPFVDLQAELEDLQVKEQIFELTKKLLSRFAKAPKMTPEARLSQKGFESISNKTAKEIGLETPLQWKQFEEDVRPDGTIAFRPFVVKHIRAKFES